MTFTDRTRPTIDFAHNPPKRLARLRTILVEIRYPAVARGRAAAGETAGATPAYLAAPFPMVLFAHGYGVMPDTYKPLLDAWVRAGFVVVAPVFPVTNYYEWTSLGRAGVLEEDVGNQPADVAYVVSRIWHLFLTDDLSRLVDPRRMAFAGQSDGAVTVAGLAFAKYFRVAWNAMPVHPRAIVILSGAEFNGAGAYSQPRDHLAVLMVHSDADHCDLAHHDVRLYRDVVRGAGVHEFLALQGADHIAPFVGVQPWASVVEDVSVDFLRRVLDSPGSAPSDDLLRDGTVRGVARLSTAASLSDPQGIVANPCGTPTPGPPTS